MSCDPIVGCANEDSTLSIMARVEVDGTNWTTANVTAISWKAWDINDRDTAYKNGSLTVGNVVFNSLQTDARWTTDTTGYNFRHDISNSVFTDPGKYRIEYTASLTGGTQIILGPYLLQINDMWTDGEA